MFPLSTPNRRFPRTGSWLANGISRAGASPATRHQSYPADELNDPIGIAPLDSSGPLRIADLKSTRISSRRFGNLQKERASENTCRVLKLFHQSEQLSSVTFDENQNGSSPGLANDR